MNQRSCATPHVPCWLRSSYKERTLSLSRNPRVQPKAIPVPVDTSPPARVAGPIPHFRKLAFAFGATATLLALVLVHQLIGLTI